MKLGNKYKYYKEYIDPKEEDYSEGEYIFAKTAYELSKYLPIENICGQGLKTKTKRVLNTELKQENKVYVHRWDWNGIPEKVKIEEIEELDNSIKVICNKGFFIFDGKTEPEFKWKKGTDDWVKKYMYRIYPTDYYYKTA